MILGLDAKPLPPSEILTRLKQVDSALGLSYITGMKTWAVTWKWSLNDPRRGLIQQGKLDPEADWDIYAYIPEDCPVDQAFGYIERAFVRNTGREHVRYLLDRLSNFNKKQDDAAMQSTLDLADELIETNAKTLFRDMGKEVGRTKAPKSSKSKDEKAYQEFLNDGLH